MPIDIADHSDRFVQYVLREGHREVEGWIEPGALCMTTLLDRLQAEAGVHGSVAEIGVHHGRYFIALFLLTRPGERALALDIFEDQHLNLDHSGLGSREWLTANLTRHAGTLDNVLMHQADSMRVQPKDLITLLGGSVRIFSVDGCHTPEHTANDIRLAASVLAPGGVVVVDDIFNPEWPGVLAGVEDFLGAGDRPPLVPIIAADNKLILCHEDYRERYRIGLEGFLEKIQGEVGTRSLLGFEVIDQPFPGLDLLLDSESHARAFGRRLLRAMRFTASEHPAYRFGPGWSSPESWGTWTDGSNAKLTLCFDSPRSGSLEIQAIASGFVKPLNSRLDVEIWIDGVEAGVWVFEGDDSPRCMHLVVSAERIRSGELVLDFHIRGACSPMELGVSNDTRRLGLGLRTIKVLEGS